MTYIRPSVKVYQQYTTSELNESPTLNPVIVGPRKEFLEYNDAEDKEKAYVGDYVGDEVTYEYPNKNPIAKVEKDTVHVFFDKAQLRYYKYDSAGNYFVRAIRSKKNQITTVADNSNNRLVFRTTTNEAGTTYNRSYVFDGRDVTNGDVTYIEAVGEKFNSKVRDVGYDKIEAVIEPATPYDTNKNSQSQTITVIETHSGNNLHIDPNATYEGSLKQNILEDYYTVTVISSGGNPQIDPPQPDPNNTGGNTANSDGGFDSLQEDTYTIEVTTGGGPGTAILTITSNLGDNNQITFPGFDIFFDVGTKGVSMSIQDDGNTSGEIVEGDKWTIHCKPSSARLSITTESGTDDVPVRAFPGFGYTFNIGERGIKASIGGEIPVLQANDYWKIRAVKQIEQVSASDADSDKYTGKDDIIYTVEVIEGGKWGEAIIKAYSNGVDSSGPFIVNNPEENYPVGNFGVKIKFADNVQEGLIKGDKWEIKAYSQKNSAATILILNDNLPDAILNAQPSVSPAQKTGGSSNVIGTGGGTYEDKYDALSKVVNEVYKIKIVQGGTPGVAQYTIESKSGLDNIDTPQTITSYGIPHSVGTCGLTITWTQDASNPQDFAVGDEWTIVVHGIDLDMELALIKNNIDLPKYKYDSPYEYAWESTDENVTIKSSIKIPDSSWKEGQEPLLVKFANTYITYEAIRQDVLGSPYLLRNEQEIIDTFGKISPKNPIAYGCSVALKNSNGVAVYGYSVKSDDLEGHAMFLNLAERLSGIYSLVPLTFDENVINQYIAHVNKVSTADKGMWRRVICSMKRDDQVALLDQWIDTNTGLKKDYKATIKDYSETNETDYIYVEATEDGNPDFIETGVREGDLFRTFYSTNAEGEIEYIEYIIAGVLSSRTLLLKSGPDHEVTVPQKFTIYRNLDAHEKAEYFGNKAANIKDKRVSLVYPDYIIDDNNELVEGYYCACAVAGLIGGVLPQQPITNYNLVGFKDAPRVYMDFSQEDLDVMAEKGVLIIAQDYKGGNIYIRHQLTTDTSSIEARELSIGKNVDHISYYLKELLRPYIGIYNINQDTIEHIKHIIKVSFENLKVAPNPQAGPQIIDAKILKLYQDPVLKDQIRAEIQLDIPYPLNVISITLII